jgi:predicted neutral ceramidase superfamily lipid hydrolase
MRRLTVTIVVWVTVLLGLATLAWFLPRRPWSFAILLAAFVLPVASGLVIGRRIRGLRQEISDERVPTLHDVSDAASGE